MDKLPLKQRAALMDRVRINWRTFGVLLLVAAAAISAGVARAVTSSDTATGEWLWPDGLGARAVADPLGQVSSMAAASGVRGPLRAIATGRSGQGSLSLVAGRNASNDVCIGYSQQDGQQALQFQCLAPDDGRKLLWVGGSGGATASSTDWTALAGVVRSDVTRVVVVLADGSTRDLPLNAQRAFTYYADSKTSPEFALIAYGADGSKLETDDLRSVPAALSP
jgi:hypothetical protein